jgi:hypothetical protein
VRLGRLPAGRRGANGSADTPGSVRSRRNVTAISLGTTLPQPSSGLPGNSGGPVKRSLSDLAPGEVYPASPITRAPGGLLHHRFTLTGLPKKAGGLLSVALSRGSLRVGVTHRPALWCPDVPRHPPKRMTRPSGRPVCPSRVPGFDTPPPAATQPTVAGRRTASCPSTRSPAGRRASSRGAGSTRRRPGLRSAVRGPRRRGSPCRGA